MRSKLASRVGSRERWIITPEMRLSCGCPNTSRISKTPVSHTASDRLSLSTNFWVVHGYTKINASIRSDVQSWPNYESTHDFCRYGSQHYSVRILYALNFTHLLNRWEIVKGRISILNPAAKTQLVIWLQYGTRPGDKGHVSEPCSWHG